MYLPRDDYFTVVAFVEGCDQGMILVAAWVPRVAGHKNGCGDNLVWWALVRNLAGQDQPELVSDMTAEHDSAAVAVLFALLDSSSLFVRNPMA